MELSKENLGIGRGRCGEPTTADRVFLDYFRCPERFAEFEVKGELSSEPGFFQFGPDAMCYGQYAGKPPSPDLVHNLPDASQDVGYDGSRVLLPFDLNQVVDNLRYERYCGASPAITVDKFAWRSFSTGLYYLLRPILPISVRKHLQRLRFQGWEQIAFPRWPVDFTVESIMQRAMALAMKADHVTRVPFIWFWPAGARSCALITHDVEGPAGRNFCGELLNLDDAFQIKSSFQVVPEGRYDTSDEFLESLRSRGFEVNVHDLHHVGSLFQEKNKFLHRAAKINQYVTQFRTQGFRAGAMYRNQDWYEAFAFSFDMSVPNVAHLEPQRGGCCTVMPYFVGKILELPLTTTEDYSLFHILGEYSIDLWKRQIEIILQKNGLVSILTHPDYILKKRARKTYMDLLAHLVQLRAERKLQIILPAELDRWHRNRNEMQLICENGTWRVEGPDKERARIAWAELRGDGITYSVDADFDTATRPG